MKNKFLAAMTMNKYIVMTPKCVNRYISWLSTANKCNGALLRSSVIVYLQVVKLTLTWEFRLTYIFYILCWHGSLLNVCLHVIAHSLLTDVTSTQKVKAALNRIMKYSIILSTVSLEFPIFPIIVKILEVSSYAHDISKYDISEGWTDGTDMQGEECRLCLWSLEHLKYKYPYKVRL